jgi:flagellar basal-body rod protein FlgC
MSNLMTSLQSSAAGMEAQAMRLRHVSENVANADTPGYQRKIVTFQESMESGLVEIGPVGLDRTAGTRVHSPGHPLADESGYYDGSNVDLVIEIADAREAQRSYEANLKLFDQARQLTQSLFDLLRR